MLVALAFTLTALAEAPLSFRDYPLGGPCPTGPEWSVGAADLDYTTWTRPEEKLTIGDTVLSRVEWMCSKASNTLVTVVISFPAHGGRTLLNTLTEQWGKPYKGNPYLDRYLWGAGPVSGYLSFSAAPEGVVLITHKKGQESVLAAQKARAAAAGGDL